MPRYQQLSLSVLVSPLLIAQTYLSYQYLEVYIEQEISRWHLCPAGAQFQFPRRVEFQFDTSLLSGNVDLINSEMSRKNAPQALVCRNYKIMQE
jgi:hypothetical protein